MNLEKIKEVRAILKECPRVVFLGGAGVSTDSGILDFRSPIGLYNIESKYGVPYETMLSHDYFENHIETFYDFYWSTMCNEDAKPNKAHKALAQYSKNHNLIVITQNIDGLDKAAGTKLVLEAHGTTSSYHCVKCGRQYSYSELTHVGVPHCKHCGGILKPDVVLYGEPLDEDVLEGSINAVKFASVLIVGGTSMRVYPIAGLPDYFLTGTKIMINKEPTWFDSQCDYVFRDNIGDVLEALLGEGE